VAGRIEFNLERVRTHFIQTLMRLEMEKKEAAEHERRQQVRKTISTSFVFVLNLNSSSRSLFNP